MKKELQEGVASLFGITNEVLDNMLERIEKLESLGSRRIRMADGDFVLGRIERLEEKLKFLEDHTDIFKVLLDTPRKQGILTDLGTDHGSQDKIK